jgi:uncharacterized protein (TIGR02996 family)
MTIAEGLLRDIVEHPDDDAPRLIYADWLDEHDDAARAEFIRTQCRLAVWHGVWVGGRPLEERIRQLEHQHGAAWLPGLPHLSGVRFEFRRGLPCVVADDFEAFRRHAPALVQVPGVHELQLLRLRGVEAMSRCPQLAQFTSLSLRHTRVGPRALRALTASPSLANLAALDLGFTRITYEGIAAIANSPHLRNIKVLNLFGNDLGFHAGYVFVPLARLPVLRDIDLGANDLHQAILALAHTIPPNLTTLRLGGNPLGDGGACQLANSAGMAGVTTLDLHTCKITSDGALALLESPHLVGLARLNLWLNGIGYIVAGKLRDRFGDGLVL